MKLIITAILLMTSIFTPMQEDIEYLRVVTQDIVSGVVQPVAEFPEATYVWNYLHSLGYSDTVSAGIIGNMMVECGGHTLDLEIAAENASYYGICQWSKKYYPSVVGSSLESQCDFLRDTIKSEINTFGCACLRGFNYESFLAITNERDAALAFAKSYERCGSGSYTLRQDCAEIALEYFLS